MYVRYPFGGPPMGLGSGVGVGTPGLPPSGRGMGVAVPAAVAVAGGRCRTVVAFGAATA